MRKFSKFLSVFLSAWLLLNATETAVAQTARSYSFEQTAGTYTPITGGFTTTTGQVDNNLTKVAIPGGFTYLGITHDSVSINNNGHISFPNLLDSNSVSSSTYTVISASLRNSGGAIAAFANDLQGHPTGEVRYEQVGNEFVVQWSNYRRYSVALDTLNFQIRLNQQNGQIKIVYGHITSGALTTRQPQVGLRGIDTSDYNNRLVIQTTGDWINSTMGNANSNTCYFVNDAPNTKPSNGLTYTYTPPTCIAPSTIVVSNISTNSATIDWSLPIGSAPTEYEYYVSTSNVLPNTIIPTGSSTTTQAVLTNLQHSTVYYVWVRSICSATDISAWSLASTFTTECDIFTVPYTQDFESVTTPALPLCTAIENLGGGNSWTTITALGSKGLRYAYNSSAANVWFYTGAIQLTAGRTYRLSYQYAVSAANYAETMHIGFGLAQDANTMTVLRSHIDVSNTTYVTAYVDFVAPTTAPYYMGFHANSPASRRNLYLDNIKLDYAPSCSEPLDFTSSNLSAYGIDLSWTTPAYGASGNYEYYIATDNTAPTAITTGTAVTGLSTTITNLTPNTAYTVWVRSVCSTTEQSEWSGPINFRTYCISTTVPYLQDFESAVTPTLPSCTSVENLGTGNIWNTAIVTSNTVLRYPYNSSNPANTWFYTQGIEMTAGTLYKISYRYAASSSTNRENLTVAYGTAATATAMINPIASHLDFNNTAYITNELYFSVPTTDVYFFGFHAHSATNRFNIYVDDILIDYAPTCLPMVSLTATNPTTNTVELNWAASPLSNSNDFEYYISTSNTAPTATSQGIVVTGTNTVATGLNHSSTYYVWVRNVCSTTDASEWSDMTTFATDCQASNIPYLLDFNNVTAPALPLCTSVENVGTGNVWTTHNALNTTLLRYYYNYSNAANTWFYTNGINLEAGQSYRVAYKYATGSTTNEENLKVAIGTTPNAANMSTVLLDQPSIIQYNQLKDTFVDFFVPTTGVYYIGFHAYSLQNKLSLYVDDIIVDKSPTCFVPTNITLENLTTTSIDLSWNAPILGTPTAYEYYLSTDNTTPTGTTTGVVVNTNSVNLNGLTPNTQYYVWVRTVCSATDQSYWTPMSSFFTGYCVPVSTSTLYYLAKVYSLGATQNISHNTTTVEHYIDSSAAVLSTVQGQTFDLVLDATTGTHKYFVWVDWNNDLDFSDTDEAVLATTTFSDSLVYPFTVPNNAPIGTFRVRVGSIYSGTNPTPCGPITNGTYFDFTLEIKDRCPQATADLLITNVCGNTQGAATMNVTSNGTTPITYLWSTGETTPSIENLNIGNYAVTVTTAPDCYIIDSFQIRSSLVAIAARPLSTDCGNASATAEVVAVGTSFDYIWSNGDTTATISGLAAGTYVVTVTDNICYKAATIEVLHEETFAITANITNVTTANDGKIEVQGPANATYLWSTGETTATIENLAIGTYEVVVTNADGCTITRNYEVQIATSVNDVLLGEITLYPNPTKQMVNLAGAPMDAKVSLINNLGQVLSTFDIQNTVQQIDLSHLAPSTYYLHVQYQDAVITLPVILIQ